MQAGNGTGNMAQATVKSVKDKPMSQPKVGTGERFKKLEHSLSARMKHHANGAPHDAGALAAYIGRKKYGKAGFQKMAAAGRSK
jgi:hypothetical protein